MERGSWGSYEQENFHVPQELLSKLGNDDYNNAETVTNTVFVSPSNEKNNPTVFTCALRGKSKYTTPPPKGGGKMRGQGLGADVGIPPVGKRAAGELPFLVCISCNSKVRALPHFHILGHSSSYFEIKFFTTRGCYFTDAMKERGELYILGMSSAEGTESPAEKTQRPVQRALQRVLRTRFS